MNSNAKIIIISLIALIVIFIAWDIYALTKVSVVSDYRSIGSSLGSMRFEVIDGNTNIYGTIRLNNPSMIPVMFSGLSYEISQGGNKIGEGQTDPIIIGPKTQKDIPIKIKLNNYDTIMSVGRTIVNTVTGQPNEKYVISFFIDLGTKRINLDSFELA